MAENDILARKQAAVQFLHLIVAGQIDEAYRKYVDLRGKHHNPFFPAGFPALKEVVVVSTNILPSFCADYNSKEGTIETPILEIFGSKCLDITLKGGGERASAQTSVF